MSSEICRINYGDKLASRITIVSHFGHAPAWGYLPLSVTIVNAGTFIGAVCFFIGAYLLLPPFGAPSPAVTEP